MTSIAIFVKTPGLSPVKSRLAADVGESRAIECHRRCARTVAAVACRAGVGPVYWAVAEDDPAATMAWTGLPVLIQQGIGLGERMQGIHDQLLLRHGSGLLLGADLPQLEQDHLRRAASGLADLEPRGVIGPAADGGFWLIGSNAAISAAAWQAPEYGGPEVMRDLLCADAAQRRWQQLPTCCDLDTLADLPAVMAGLRALPSPHTLQLELLDWLGGLAARNPKSPPTIQT